mgnify:CR=1 FL=1
MKLSNLWPFRRKEVTVLDLAADILQLGASKSGQSVNVAKALREMMSEDAARDATYEGPPDRAPYRERDLRMVEKVAHRAALFVENLRLRSAEQRATRMRDEVLGIVAHDLDAAGRARHEADQRAQQGRLAGARRADHGGQPGRPDLQVQPVENGLAAHVQRRAGHRRQRSAGSLVERLLVVLEDGRLHAGEARGGELGLVRDGLELPHERELIGREPEVDVEVGVERAGRGVGGGGGFVDQKLSTLRVTVRPDSIPTQLTANISNMDVEDVLTVADLTLPSGVTTEIDPTTPIVTAALTRAAIVAARAAAKAEEAAAAGA